MKVRSLFPPRSPSSSSTSRLDVAHALETHPVTWPIASQLSRGRSHRASPQFATRRNTSPFPSSASNRPRSSANVHVTKSSQDSGESSRKKASNKYSLKNSPVRSLQFRKLSQTSTCRTRRNLYEFNWRFN